MENEPKILVDSDAFVGQYFEKDVHFKEATKLFDKLEEKETILLTTNMVVAETATVLSHRSGQALARIYLEDIVDSAFPVLHVAEKLHQQAIDIFKVQASRGTSMTDCANVAVMKRFEISTIFSFDKFYGKQPGLELLSDQK